MDNKHCGFCRRVLDDEHDLFVTCLRCGASRCGATCPAVCCEQAIANAVDAWLAGLAEIELERL